MVDVMVTKQLESLLLHAPRYELGAALRVLHAAGFEWHEIRFEGIRELQTPRGPFIRSVRLETQPARRAIISVNAGLLSPGSPLPGYFRQFARRLPDPDAFISFLGFWDSLQLWGLAFATVPQLSVGRDGLLGKTYRARLRLGSPMGLQWLFRSLFPELEVRVELGTFVRGGRGQKARVGSTLDGRLVIGADFTGRCLGFRVRLSASENACEGVADWESEVRRRIDRVEPLLNGVARPLEVTIHFESYRHGQRLVARSSARPQLGVRPWLLAEPEAELGPADVVIRAASSLLNIGNEV